MQVNARLKAVILSWNGLDKATAASLRECLKHNETLQELDISNNRFTAEDAAVMASGLSHNENLVVLKVNYIDAFTVQID